MYTRKVAVPKALLDGPAVLAQRPPGHAVEDPVGASRRGRSRPDRGARAARRGSHATGICLIGAGPRPERVPKDSLAAVQRLQGITRRSRGRRRRDRRGRSVRRLAAGASATARRASCSRRPRRRALICFNDRLALGAYQALADAGLDVPGRRVRRVVRRRPDRVMGQAAAHDGRAPALRARTRGDPASCSTTAEQHPRRRKRARPPHPDAAARA